MSTKIFCSKCPPFARTQARIKSRTPLVDRIVNDALFKTVPHLNQTTLQIVNISHLRLVNTFLHRTPHFVIRTAEKFWKSVNICLRYGQKYRGPFFDSQCMYAYTCVCMCVCIYSYFPQQSIQNWSYVWLGSTCYEKCRSILVSVLPKKREVRYHFKP